MTIGGGPVGSRGGKSPGGKGAWNPGRPADVAPRRVPKVPQGVQGHSLGGGAKRAGSRGGSSCLVLAVAMASGALGLVYAGYEAIRAVIS